MRSTTRVVLTLAAIAIASPRLHAQTCLGLPAATVASRNLSLEASFPEGQSNFLGRLGGIGKSGAFAGLSVSYLSFDDADASAIGIGVDVGKELSLAPESAVRVCPIASAELLFGPNLDFGGGDEIKTNSFLGSAGGAIGGVISASPGLSLVPFASLSLAYFNVRASFEGESESESETGGVLTVGIGLSFSDRVIVRPTVSKPFGFDGDSDAVIGIGISLPIGRR